MKKERQRYRLRYSPSHGEVEIRRQELIGGRLPGSKIICRACAANRTATTIYEAYVIRACIDSGKDREGVKI